MQGQDPDIAPAADSIKAARTNIPAGTMIELVTRDAVSSKTNDKGDLLYLSLTKPVIIEGAIAIPAGTIVVGQLTLVDKKGAFGKSGKIEAQLLYAELPGGPIRVSGALTARGQGTAGDAMVTVAAFLALPFAATGRSAEIPAGSEVVGNLDRDVWIDATAPAPVP